MKTNIYNDEKIIDALYHHDHSNFLTIKELMQVRGIGEKSAIEAYNMLHGLPLNRD